MDDADRVPCIRARRAGRDGNAGVGGLRGEGEISKVNEKRSKI